MNLQIKAIALLLIAVFVAGIAVPFASACSTRTPGYWKNHDWSIGSTFTYTDNSISPAYTHTWTIPIWFTEATLQTPVKGDARINLEQKVIAAVLSIQADNRDGWAWPGNYNGGPMVGITLPQLITLSINLLNANPSPWTPGSAADISGVRATGLAYASAIDYWLNFYDEAPIV